MTANPSTSPCADVSDTVTLAPRFWVPLVVIVLAASSLLLLPVWSGVRWLVMSGVLISLFLTLQTALLRLRFTEAALVICRRDTVIRHFPYQDWLGWKLFWPPLPVLFYFRETHSIHLLPVLFDATALRVQLQQRLPHLGSPTPR